VTSTSNSEIQRLLRETFVPNGSDTTVDFGSLEPPAPARWIAPLVRPEDQPTSAEATVPVTTAATVAVPTEVASVTGWLRLHK